MKPIGRALLVGVWLVWLSIGTGRADEGTGRKKITVLVYTKNGKGYVHDNISAAVQGLQQLGQQHGFTVEVTDQPTVFTEERLKTYTALIFASTNNDVFDTDAQRLAFRRYMEAGGGFVGIHSVMGTERNWAWFKRMLGGTFAWHPPFQRLRILAIAPDHPSIKGVPAVWEKDDECYFAKNMSPGPTVVMAHDLSVLNPAEQEKINTNRGSYTELYPAVWYYNFDGGHTWVTTLGHDKKDYADPTFLHHLLEGINFITAQVQSVNFSRAYATTFDAPIR